MYLFSFGWLLCGFALLQRGGEGPALTNELQRDLAVKNDVQIGIVAPKSLNSRLGTGQRFVVYLPETKGYTGDSGIPDKLPNALAEALFVKLTPLGSPKFLEEKQTLIDSDGSIQRSLHAFTGTRIYRFNGNVLADKQSVSETWEAFLERSKP